MMNSYFEQGGFYGQTSAAAAGTEQAYRFPLGLAGMGVSPYAHQQTRPPQDYDNGGGAASPKASGLYSPLNDAGANAGTTPSYKSNSSSGSGGGAAGSVTPGATSDCASNKDQNGYSSLSSKELNAAASGWSTSTGPVRPSAGTPDMSRYTPSAVDVAARDRWMNTCSGLTSVSQASQPQLQQSANHTFYPWMAIAGKFFFFSFTFASATL